MNMMTGRLGVATSLLQQVCTFLLTGAAIVLAALTAAAAAGAVPWLDLPVSRGGEPMPRAGMLAQVGVTFLMVCLAGFLPSIFRVRRLELTNRNFHLSMEDVARAYQHVHRADREGAFELSREFDDMRDRIDRIRSHPELAGLENDVLQVAAQMSVESRDLARIYADDKVERARAFLRQRQQEVEEYRQRISMAQDTVGEIRRWMQAVNVEEGLAETMIDRLQHDLAELTDALGLTSQGQRPNVVGMARARREATAPSEPWHATPAAPSEPWHPVPAAPSEPWYPAPAPALEPRHATPAE